MAESQDAKTGVQESWIGRGNNALLRGISTPGVAAIGLTCISLSYGGLLLFPQLAGAWPGENLVGMITLALVFCLLPAATYALIGAAVPRSGADYILASRVLNGPVAFISSWVFVASSALAAGSLVAVIPKTILPIFLKATSLIFPNTNLADVSVTLGQPQIQILIGTVITVIAFLTMLVSQRTFLRILTAGILLAVAAWVLICIVLGSSSPQQFQFAWDQVMGLDSFDQVIPSARALGFASVAQPVGVIPGGLLVGFLIFFGFHGTTFIAGEVKKPERNLLRGSWLGLIAAWGVLAGATVLLQRVVAPEWLSAQSFLSQNPAYTGSTMPWIHFYAAILAPDLAVLLLMLAAWIYTWINLVQTYILFASRILLSWADDGLIPAGMAYVHPRYRSPVVTMLAAAVLVQFGLVFSLLNATPNPQSNFIYFAVISMLVPVTAATFFPFLKKSWFEACPPFVRARLGPLPVISLLGILTLIYLIFLLAAPVLFPGGPAPDGLSGLIAFGVMIILGLFWYGGRRINLRSKGIKVEDTFKSLPRSS
jgi:basic amino acid/polyamine antiporter, APA family